MVNISLEVELYDLQMSLEPSFISSLYENPKRRSWIKITGWLRGLKIDQRGSILKSSYPGDLNKIDLERITILETGLWHEAFEERIRGAPRRFRPALEILASEYPGVRIPIAPHDFQFLFFSVLLSKRADYRLVRRWCAAVWRIIEDDLEELMSLNADALREVTRSYQLYDALRSIRSATEHFKGLSALHRSIISKPPEVARVMLMKIWGIGSKVADSLILSTFRATHFAPCDTHLIKLVKALDLIRGFKLPNKNLCMRFACSRKPIAGLQPCPQYNTCLRGILSSSLEGLAGWFQTLAYLHGRRYCTRIKPRCRSCPLKTLCSLYY